jgi:hypothetical protein
MAGNKGEKFCKGRKFIYLSRLVLIIEIEKP